MSRRGEREFWCTVVSESVLIRLRRADGFGPDRGHVVQCNQTECQYVDENVPPCPLHVGMFAEEIKAAEAARRSRDEYENR
jgi:hypothetical protein